MLHLIKIFLPLFVARLPFLWQLCCLIVAQSRCPGQHKGEMMLHTATFCYTRLQLATMSSNIRLEKIFTRKEATEIGTQFKLSARTVDDVLKSATG